MGGGGWSFMDRFFQEKGFSLKAINSRYGPSNFCFSHELAKAISIFPYSVAFPLYPRCVPSRLVVERRTLQGIVGQKEDSYNPSRTSSSHPPFPCVLPLAINKRLLRVGYIDCSSPQDAHRPQLVKHKKCLRHRLLYERILSLYALGIVKKRES